MADQAVRLVLLDQGSWQHWFKNPLGYLSGLGTNAKQVLEWVKHILAQSREYYSKHPYQVPWIEYLVIEQAQSRIVACGGFKGPPNARGEVEISYGTFPDFQRRGYGTAAARALVELAFAEKKVIRVIAHTLPTNSASAQILTKNGFRCEGEVMDDADGLVWRWAKDQGASSDWGAPS